MGISPSPSLPVPSPSRPSTALPHREIRRTGLSLALLLLLCFSLAASEVFISFERSGYRIREVLDEIEEQTPYDLQFPFVDGTNELHLMPRRIELGKLLLWIEKAYEKTNDRLIRHDIVGSEIRFLDNLPPSSAGEPLVALQKKVSLKGQDWTVHQALQSASRQSGISIDLPLVDHAEIKAPYHYECTVEELLEEVRSYWRRHNGRELSYRRSGTGIVFFERGESEGLPLEVQLVGRITQHTQPLSDLPSRQPKSPTLKERIRHLVLPDAEKAQPEPAPASPEVEAVEAPTPVEVEERPVLEEPVYRPIESLPDPEPPAPKGPPAAQPQIEALLKHNPLDFIAPHRYSAMATAWIRPHDLSTQGSDLLDRIRPHAADNRHHQRLVRAIGELDLSALNPYGRKQALRQVEEHWLKILLQTQQSRNAPKASDRGWHLRYRAEGGYGRHPQKGGEQTLRDTLNTGAWLGHDVRLEHRHNPLGPWRFQSAFVAGSRYGIDMAQEDLSHTHYGIDLRGFRDVSTPGWRGVEPHLAIESYSDALVPGDGVTKQVQWTAGVSVHWLSSGRFGSFNRSQAATDIFALHWRPEDGASRAVAGQGGLRQKGAGLRHRMSWFRAKGNTIEGPRASLHLVHRDGSHPTIDGTEWGLEMGYVQVDEQWQRSIDLLIEQWRRDQAVDVTDLRIAITRKDLAFLRGDVGAEAALVSSSSDDPVADYNSATLTLKLEWNW